ncbi:hypothetical protein [Variovorax sp. Root318D1]|uniref:hypothetical protein n=1 Tax=Variovorax sp. Root318D1 TaxID=1736513 RepID=UPI0012FB824B|nr:hypothetical protein [Variovorax sp. Root318D1]
MEKVLSKIAHHNDGPQPLVSTRGRVSRGIIFYAIAVWRNGSRQITERLTASTGLLPTGLQRIASRR